MVVVARARLAGLAVGELLRPVSRGLVAAAGALLPRLALTAGRRDLACGSYRCRGLGRLWRRSHRHDRRPQGGHERRRDLGLVRAADQLLDLGSCVRLVCHLARGFHLAAQEACVHFEARRDAVLQEELDVVTTGVLHLQRRVHVHVELVDARIELVLGHIVAEAAGRARKPIGLGLGQLGLTLDVHGAQQARDLSEHRAAVQHVLMRRREHVRSLEQGEATWSDGTHAFGHRRGDGVALVANTAGPSSATVDVVGRDAQILPQHRIHDAGIRASTWGRDEGPLRIVRSGRWCRCECERQELQSSETVLGRVDPSSELEL